MNIERSRFSSSRALLLVVAALVLLVGQLLSACSTETDTAGGGNTGPGANGTGATTGAAGSGGIPLEGLSTIVLTPADSILEVDLGTSASVPFTALGYYQDGHSADVTSVVIWESSLVGSFSGATLELPPTTTAGAVTTMITASLEGCSGLAQLTVVTYRKTGANTDFFFILPYQDPAGTQNKPLDFTTTVKALDVLFAMDTTGSMDEEVVNLQLSLSYLVIPTIKALVANTWFGAAAFMDFPVSGYGTLHGTDCGGSGRDEPDQPFQLFQALTNDPALIQAGVDAYSDANGQAIGCGGTTDRPESLLEALYQAATGNGLPGPGFTFVAANHTGVGGVAFRAGSMPVIVAVGDSPSHTVGEPGLVCNRPSPVPDFTMEYGGEVATMAHSRQQAKDATNAICGKVVGVAGVDTSLGWPDNCFALTDLEDFAIATGTRVPPEAWDVPQRPANCAAGLCCTDFDGAGRAPDADNLCPLVFKVDKNGNGLSDSISTGVQMLTRYATFEVVTELEGETVGIYGEPLPVNTTTAEFISAIIPHHFTKAPPPPTLPDPIMTSTGFQNVTPGTVVSFTVDAFNDFVPATQSAQFFRAVIHVLAGGCTELDQREVLILVPPEPLIPPR